MHNLSPIGIVLYMILSIVGGGLTGLFAGYLYFVLRKEFSVILTILISIVFYIVPVWALIRLFENDDSFIFYLGLILSYVYGANFSRKVQGDSSGTRRNYGPPDDE